MKMVMTAVRVGEPNCRQLDGRVLPFAKTYSFLVSRVYAISNASFPYISQLIPLMFYSFFPTFK